MENKTCKIISDLMPLYVDGVCGEESKLWIEEHLKECETCGKLYDAMKKDFRMPENAEQRQEDARIIKKVKRRIWIERGIISLLVLFTTCFLAYHALAMLTVQNKNINDEIDLNMISVEQDHEGNLWLVRDGKATMAQSIYNDIYTMDGEVMLSLSDSVYKELDENSSYQLRINFTQDALQYYIQKIFFLDPITKEERSKLVSKEKLGRYKQIIIKQTDGTEKILWEREEE